MGSFCQKKEEKNTFLINSNKFDKMGAKFQTKIQIAPSVHKNKYK